MLRKDAGHQRSNRKNTFLFSLSAGARGYKETTSTTKRNEISSSTPSCCVHKSQQDRSIINSTCMEDEHDGRAFLFSSIKFALFRKKLAGPFSFLNVLSVRGSRTYKAHTKKRSVLSSFPSRRDSFICREEPPFSRHILGTSIEKRERREVFFLNYIESASQSSKIIEVTFHLRPPYMLHKEGRRA